MRRAARGDPDAFAEIYDRHVGVLLAVASRRLPTGEALEVVHDVFLEAWQHVRDFDPERASPRTWLLVRLRSRALDRHARVARGARASEALAVTPALVHARTEPLEQSRQDTHRDIIEALRELDEETRRVLELTYLAGLTAVEVSGREGIPVGTVRSRLARGLRRLRGLLDLPEDHDD